MAGADPVGAARAELATREQARDRKVAAGSWDATEADRTIAVWRRIVVIAEQGSVDLADEEDPRAEWPPLVDAVERALEHRLGQRNLSQEQEAHLAALAQLRWALWRAALHAGAFDIPRAAARLQAA